MPLNISHVNFPIPSFSIHHLSISNFNTVAKAPSTTWSADRSIEGIQENFRPLLRLSQCGNVSDYDRRTKVY